MIKSLFFFITSIFIILSISPLYSHDMWLVPEKYVLKPGEVLTIMGNTGMDFPQSLNAVSPKRVNDSVIVGESEKMDLTDLKVQGKSLISTCILKKPGTYVAAISLKPKEIKLTAKEFNEYLLHDGLENIYKLRKKANILDKNAVEHYSKYPKTIIQVGDKMDTTPTKPLKLAIEIVPLVNPYTLKKGDRLKVMVLFKGKSLANQELAWSFPGQGEKFAGKTISDKYGKASIPLLKKGPYVIRLTYMEWVKQKTHEWESYWTSLTFFVLAD